MTDGVRQVGRRQTDNPDYLRQLESCLARSEQDNAVLQGEINRLKELIKGKDAELVRLRMLQADVLTAAIAAGFDGLPKTHNQNEGKRDE